MKSIVVGMLLLTALPAGAQEPTVTGTRVRALARDGTLAIGTLQSVSVDSIRLVDDAGRLRALPRADLRLEQSLGRRTSFGKHFAIVTGATAAAGALISGLTWDECPQCIVHPASRIEAFGWGLVAGAVVGIPIGVIAGLAIKVERWQPLPLERLGSSVHPMAPARDRFALAAAVRFR